MIYTLINAVVVPVVVGFALHILCELFDNWLKSHNRKRRKAKRGKRKQRKRRKP